MSTPDLNLLVTLDVILAEGSVAHAGLRLRLNPSAMSRALSRLRATMGDPLLVRGGHTSRSALDRGKVTPSGTCKLQKLPAAIAALRSLFKLDPPRIDL